MKTVRVDGMPDEPLAAASLFHQHWLAHVEHKLEEGDVTVALDPADYRHRDWRGAIARDLARKHAPRRINVVSGTDVVIEAFAAYLEHAPGITGQYFEGDGHGAGDPAG
jgi:hypothetical protein